MSDGELKKKTGNNITCNANVICKIWQIMLITEA